MLASNRGDDLVVLFLSEPLSDPFVQFLCSSVEWYGEENLMESLVPDFL